jgi:hypothetical protein
MRNPTDGQASNLASRNPSATVSCDPEFAMSGSLAICSCKSATGLRSPTLPGFLIRNHREHTDAEPDESPATADRQCRGASKCRIS